MRILFFAGKGGVGKTSVAAATGIRASEMGLKTVVMSLDVAHSLSDIFDLEQNLLDQNKGEPYRINDRLWIQELDIQEEIQRNWGDIHKYLATLFNTTGLEEVLAEELAILPGMEEISLLLYINQYVTRKTFDLIVLDCAPTGESLRFISIPTTLEWYMKKIFKMERTIARVARPIAKQFTDVPLPGDDYFKALETLYNRLKGVDRILNDPDITSVRLVTNPEKIVLKETQRAFMYFSLYHMAIDGIIINRLLPNQLTDAYFDGWLSEQKAYLEKAEAYFNPVPIFTVDLFPGEILGYESLKSLAEKIYGSEDPTQHFFKEEPFTVTKTDGCYRLRVKLPFIARDNVDMARISDELVVRIGSFKRHMLLPKQIAALSSARAKIEGHYLNIYFDEGNHGGKI